MKIERGIPMPTHHAVGGWAEMVNKMKPGDSIKMDRESQRDAAAMAALRLGISYVTRKVEDGYRIWRTA